MITDGREGQALGQVGIVALTSFLAGILLIPPIGAAARRWGFLDRPNQRSSHREITPRGGGVAVLIAVLAGLLWVPGVWDAAGKALLAGTLVVAVAGLVDDRFGLSAAPRLLLHALAAAGVVWAAGGLLRLPLPPPLDLPTGMLAVPLALLWIVAVVNFYNFLDGIDGLAGAQGVVAGLALLAATFDTTSALLGAAVAGACAAFVIFNWAPASIFLGDVGSGSLGFLFAAAPFLAPPTLRPQAVLLVALVLWFFLADATWTLGARAWRGERWYEAHRQHLYQRLVISGWSHARVSLLLALGATLVALFALLGYKSGHPAAAWTALGVALVAFWLEAWLVRRREARLLS
jgi:UDP-N-acetylmuramyl pentapeptide phosphotransferase/UDP-N-acetylglucosamine-1-phosphate transferase